ncbi:isochorismatase family protein [Pararhizobium sp. BT-229]|uniref:isochorismatase family protein n=1 Tax=Pararhizobium sp. BT-229 TaxID=2986923 RepID=UPI003558EC0F
MPSARYLPGSSRLKTRCHALNVARLLWQMVDDDRRASPAGDDRYHAVLEGIRSPGQMLHKRVYSPWFDGRLHEALLREQVSTLVISGGETDVCVLATVMGASDLGCRRSF